MIVEKMTDLELLNEVMRDYESICIYMDRLKDNSAYKKRLQWAKPKNGLFVIRINDWKSPQGNIYHFIIKTAGWKEFKKGEVKSISLTFFKRNNVHNAIRIVCDKDGVPGIEILTSHFIDRYNQRLLKQPYLSFKEVVFQFVERNKNVVMNKVDSPKYDFNMMMGIDDGYVFGKFENERIVVDKTFVTREMLFGGQFDSGDFLDEAIVDSKNGSKSNIFNFNQQLDEIVCGERLIPTMEDLVQISELIEKKKLKEAALELDGKDYDLEMMEIMNQIFLWISKFDLTKGQIKDKDGNIVDYPLLKEVSLVINATTNKLGKLQEPIK